ncbi:MAG: 50S ribosomal protein L23 [Candidatus Aenigmarchaeota archaeon]|nr:50S ribosomal protein L23 [Candidatus Aenigmarchaeota archaeon]
MKEGLPEKKGNLKKGTRSGLPEKRAQAAKPPKAAKPAKEAKSAGPALPQEQPKDLQPKEKGKDYNPWVILRYPHLAEKSMGLVESQNTLTFIVDRRATKRTVAEAVAKGFSVEVRAVRITTTQKGVKKAYVQLGPKHSAADIATRLGMI